MRLKALLLAFLVLFSTIAHPVFAADTAIADAGFDTAKSFLSQLGICEGITPNADEQITRAEFVAMLVRSMNVGITNTSETIFTDLDGNPFVAEIYMAKNLGITNGTSETTFSPDDGMLSETAAKMIATALGYSLPAESYGGYPTGYLRVSQSLNLFDGVLNTEDALTVRDSFVIIYNALLADVAFSNGDNEIGTNPGKNLLTENFRLSHISGVLTTAGFYAVSPEYAGNGIIEISGKVFKTGTHINAESYFGQNVSVWYDADSKQVRVISANNVNNIKIINAKDVTNFTANTLTVENDDYRQKKYTMDTALTFVQNGRVIAHDSDSFIYEDGSLKLIDNNGDGRYDFVVAEKIEYFVISAINNYAIYDVNSAYKCIDFDTDSSKSYSIELNGAPADITDLEKDMVLEVLMSEDGDVCRVRGNDANSLQGTVDEIGDNEITVNGKVYSLNTYFQNLSIPLSAGKEYTFFLAPNGSITSISGISADNANYGYLLDYAGRQSLSQGPAIKVLTSYDEREIYYFADKLRLNGTPVKNDDSRIVSLLTNGEFPKYQVIRYKLTDGKVTMLDTEVLATSGWNPGNNYDDDNYLTKYADKTKVTYRSGFGVPNIAFKSSIVFTVPQKLTSNSAAEYDERLFTCTGTSRLSNDDVYTADAYDFDKNYLPAVTVVYNAAETFGTSNPGSSATAYMVCGVSDAVNSENEVTKLIKVFDSGVYNEFYVKPEFVETFKTAKLIPGPGDVVRFVLDKKNQISGIALDVDYDESTKSFKVNYGTAKVSKSPTGLLSYFTGQALTQTAGYLTIRYTNAPTASSPYVDDIINLALGTVKYAVYDSASGQVRAGTASDIVTENDAGTLGAVNVVCKTQYYSVNRIYIYR